MVSLDERQSEKWRYIVLFRINIIYFSLLLSNYEVVLVNREIANMKLS